MSGYLKLKWRRNWVEHFWITNQSQIKRQTTWTKLWEVLENTSIISLINQMRNLTNRRTRVKIIKNKEIKIMERIIKLKQQQAYKRKKKSKLNLLMTNRTKSNPFHSRINRNNNLPKKKKRLRRFNPSQHKLVSKKTRLQHKWKLLKTNKRIHLKWRKLNQ